MKHVFGNIILKLGILKTVVKINAIYSELKFLHVQTASNICMQPYHSFYNETMINYRNT